MQQNDELLSFVDKKLYSGLFLKRISQKLLDKESGQDCFSSRSWIVRDKQNDNVLRDLLHCLHGYLTFYGQVYSFNFLFYPDMPSKSKNRFLLLFW